MIINDPDNDPDNDVDADADIVAFLSTPPKYVAHTARPESAPPNLERVCVAMQAPRPQRSQMYLPHTLNPQRCCSTIACSAMTTTIMCASHYPSIERASSVHAAVVALRKMCVVVATMRGAATTPQPCNAFELGKAMTMLFDVVWFNRHVLVAEMRDAITMRRVFVENCECLANLNATAARRFRERHQWILWWPDHDVVV